MMVSGPLRDLRGDCRSVDRYASRRSGAVIHNGPCRVCSARGRGLGTFKTPRDVHKGLPRLRFAGVKRLPSFLGDRETLLQRNDLVGHLRDKPRKGLRHVRAGRSADVCVTFFSCCRRFRRGRCGGLHVPRQHVQAEVLAHVLLDSRHQLSQRFWGRLRRPPRVVEDLALTRPGVSGELLSGVRPLFPTAGGERSRSARSRAG